MPISSDRNYANDMNELKEEVAEINKVIRVKIELLTVVLIMVTLLNLWLIARRVWIYLHCWVIAILTDDMVATKLHWIGFNTDNVISHAYVWDHIVISCTSSDYVIFALHCTVTDVSTHTYVHVHTHTYVQTHACTFTHTHQHSAHYYLLGWLRLVLTTIF